MTILTPFTYGFFMLAKCNLSAIMLIDFCVLENDIAVLGLDKTS